MTTTTFVNGQTPIVADWLNDVNAHVYDEVVHAHNSDNIDFTQAGTGAVPRNAQDKMRESVSVLDFGAVGDGVTDDTASIQAAIDYIVSIGGGELYFSATTGYYKVTSTLTIDTTPNSVTIRGGGKWRSEIYLKSAVTTSLFSTAGLVRFKDISICGLQTSGNIFRVGDIAIANTGVIELDNISLYGFQYGMVWGGGYYHKFVNCDFRQMATVLQNFNANNVIVDRCKVYAVNRFILTTGGAGPVVITNSAFEAWTTTLFGVSSNSPLYVIKNNYFENSPTTAVAAGLIGTYYDAGTVVVNTGDTVLDSNMISCNGIFRIIDTGGTARSVRSINNYIVYQALTSNTQYFYNIGTANTYIFQDYANNILTGQTGSYSTASFFAVNPTYPQSSIVIDPITLLDRTPEMAWVTIAPTNGWADVNTTNYQPVSYKKIGSRVYLRGYVTGASATLSTIVTLPVGYRPTTKTYRVLSANTLGGTPVAVSLRMQSNGELFVNNTAYTTLTTLPLDGLSFEID